MTTGTEPTSNETTEADKATLCIILDDQYYSGDTPRLRRGQQCTVVRKNVLVLKAAKRDGDLHHYFVTPNGEDEYIVSESAYKTIPHSDVWMAQVDEHNEVTLVKREVGKVPESVVVNSCDMPKQRQRNSCYVPSIDADETQFVFLQ